MFFCRSTMSTAYIWCTDLAYCKWQDSISLVSLSLHLRKMASLTWCWLYSYVHVLCYACAEDARENLSQKKKTKPILKLGAFHCWSVRLCVYKAGFPNTTFFILELLPTHRLFFFPYFSIISRFTILYNCTFLWDYQDQEQWSRWDYSDHQRSRWILAPRGLSILLHHDASDLGSLIMIRTIPKERTLRNHLKPRRLILGRNLIYRFFILSSVFSSWFYYFFKLSAIRYDGRRHYQCFPQ